MYCWKEWEMGMNDELVNIMIQLGKLSESIEQEDWNKAWKLADRLWLWDLAELRQKIQQQWHQSGREVA